DELSALSVARATGGGVYRIEPEQWDRLVQALGGWPDEDDDEVVLEAVQAAKAKARGQGFSSSPEVRKAIEQHAMKCAEAAFCAEAFAVKVFGKPYDRRCTRGDEVLYVEVKGTSTAGEDVLLAPNEVKFARENASRMALFLCYGMDVKQGDVGVVATGGT